MVEVTRRRTERIDYLLAIIEAYWQALPVLTSRSKEWDAEELSGFILEWPLQYSHLDELRENVVAGNLSTDQMMRYQQLKDMMRRNLPYASAILGKYKPVAPLPIVEEGQEAA